MKCPLTLLYAEHKTNNQLDNVNYMHDEIRKQVKHAMPPESL